MNSEYFLKRFEAVFLHLHHRRPKLSIPATAKEIATEHLRRKMVKLLDQNPGISLRKGVERLRRTKISISTETLRKRLCEESLKYRSTMKKPLLTKIHIEKRKHWATENLDTDWKHVIYTVESSFWLANPLTHSWCRATNRPVVHTIKHPQKVHVYGAFCEKGFGKLTVFTGNLNVVRMNQLYKSTLLPTADKFYGKRNRKWPLLEDNVARTQKSSVHSVEERKWYQANGMAATVSRFQSDRKCLGASQEQAKGQIIQKFEASQCIPSTPMEVIFQKIC